MKDSSARRRGRTGTFVGLVMALMLALPLFGGGAQAQEKIINGQPAGKWAFPFMARVWFGGEVLCNGTLIAPGQVLLPASCTYQLRIHRNNGFVVKPLRSADLAVSFSVDGADAGASSRRPVTRIIRRPGFDADGCLNEFTCHHNAAILEVRQVPAGAAPVDLVAAGEVGYEREGRTLTAVGWGPMRMNDSSSVQVTQAMIPVMDQAVCAKRYQTLTGYPGTVQDLFDEAASFCTYRTTVGPCFPEIGGPALVERDHRWLQVGMLNGMASCAIPKWPNVYARISEPGLNEWIRATTMATGPGAKKGGRS
ncbi:MAG: S1 family peptidase [Thermomicrobiales bacterium]